jgi:hypothetical protein
MRVAIKPIQTCIISKANQIDRPQNSKIWGYIICDKKGLCLEFNKIKLKSVSN